MMSLKLGITGFLELGFLNDGVQSICLYHDTLAIPPPLPQIIIEWVLDFYGVKPLRFGLLQQ